MTTREWLTVGIDETEGSRAATRWAAHEAVRRGLALRIVRVYESVVPMGGFYASVYPAGPVDARRFAERLVARAVNEAREIMPAERIHTRLVCGDRRTSMLQEADEAALLVLGDQRLPLTDRLFTGSLLVAVAAHAPVPVVLVPAGWDPEHADRPVVAAVKTPDSSRELVRQALELAAARRAPLLLLHAWEYPSGYDELIANHVDLVEWQERARKELTQLADEATGTESALRGVRGPGVEVRVVHGQPARALADASRTAGLLVIGRRRHAFPFGHLGGTGRAVIRETRCPLMVLPATTPSERDQS